MGIVTWASLRCEVLPKVQKFFLVPSERLDTIIGFAYKLLRIRFHDEFLLLNSSTLASILGEGAEQIMGLRKELPPWILIFGLAGRDLLPEEKVEFLEKDIGDIAQQFGVRLESAIPGARAEQVAEAVLNPSKEPYWKLRRQGRLPGHLLSHHAEQGAGIRSDDVLSGGSIQVPAIRHRSVHSADASGYKLPCGIQFALRPGRRERGDQGAGALYQGQ